MKVLETQRLRLRGMTLDDAPFVLQLVNEPSWLRFIGDRGVRTLEDAQRYVRDVPQASYARHGFGLLRVEALDGTAMGMCGLLKREVLEDVDIGFAFFPAYWGQGYAFEAAQAVLAHARQELGLPRVAAIVDPTNASSIKLLERLGFRFARPFRMSGEAQEISLYLTQD
ncbi:GNAT family N-acetyltransferase [Myxococcus sp. K15C18031901]|uniref:GNAT family N-acetyltransferase n=1 Tax=Myxococcus dinghuensis TaxID=2906761 RepID=UPI0020A7FD6D|nr:GNAT family N-acetyltransferase [Myxococcus dinghuensis]MCP3101605.1 GNAT family N-acetyltransferase [Myxococcus dinghuensis]